MYWQTIKKKKEKKREGDTSLRWKMPAASAAEALVFSKTSEKCCTTPAPLLAMTGIVTASDTSFINSMSYPSPWPIHTENHMYYSYENKRG